MSNVVQFPLDRLKVRADRLEHRVTEVERRFERLEGNLVRIVRPAQIVPFPTDGGWAA